MVRPFVPISILDSFRDTIVFRDPRGRSTRPGIVPATREGTPGLQLGGAFNLFLSYGITKGQGRRFVEATGDENPIHREGDIVPGAMTVSKVLLPLEVLLPAFQTERIKIQFRHPGFYGRPFRASFSWRQTGPGVQIQAQVYQGGESVARCGIAGTLDEDLPRTRAPLVHRGGLKDVRSFFESLRIDSRAFLEPGGRANYVYPLSFVASLPSGEMVRSFRGDGGMINSLRLEFQKGRRIPVGKRPKVQLEPSGVRTAFRKVVTRIVEGIDTYCQGFALVLPPAP
jgi:hypothetical protein